MERTAHNQLTSFAFVRFIDPTKIKCTKADHDIVVDSFLRFCIQNAMSFNDWPSQSQFLIEHQTN